MVGLLVGGLVAYPLLPVAALPNVNYPTLTVTAQLPGADPQTMASSVATPLELQFGADPGPHPDDVGERARLYVQITLQFELSRADRWRGQRHAVGDQRGERVSADRTCRIRRRIRKVNPADTPILVLGADFGHAAADHCRRLRAKIFCCKRSRRYPASAWSASAASRSRPIRVQVDPQALAASRHQPGGRAHGARPGQCRSAEGHAQQPARRPSRSTPTTSCSSPTQYDDLVIAYRNGSPVRIRDVGRAISAAGERADRGLVQQATAAIILWRSSASPAPTSSRR